VVRRGVEPTHNFLIREIRTDRCARTLCRIFVILIGANLRSPKLAIAQRQRGESNPRVRGPPTASLSSYVSSDPGNVTPPTFPVNPNVYEKKSRSRTTIKCPCATGGRLGKPLPHKQARISPGRFRVGIRGKPYGQ